MNYPFDDEYMKYDFEEHRYVLTSKAVLDKLGTDLNVVLNKGRSANPQELANLVLDDISSTVYTEIYEQSNQNEIQEYILAKCSSARKVIFNALLEQTKYFLINGAIETYSGVDFRKGTVMPDFSGKVLAPHARQKLNKILDETGYSIMYTGHYPMLFKVDYEANKY